MLWWTVHHTAPDSITETVIHCVLTLFRERCFIYLFGFFFFFFWLTNIWEVETTRCPSVDFSVLFFAHTEANNCTLSNLFLVDRALTSKFHWTPINPMLQPWKALKGTFSLSFHSSCSMVAYCIPPMSSPHCLEQICLCLLALNMKVAWFLTAQYEELRAREELQWRKLQHIKRIV